MSIRAATGDDATVVCQIAEQAWKHDYTDVLTRDTAGDAVNEWYSRERVEEELERDRTVLLVAERGGTDAGFAHATVDDAGEVGYVLRLYVHPEHRRAGVGRELLERACAELADHGVEQIDAMVLAENERGNAFYEHFGFERVDERDTTIGGESYPENRYVLERPFDLDGE
jgi:ribosomal protein S18 acetylase RimI-like enzyme